MSEPTPFTGKRSPTVPRAGLVLLTLLEAALAAAQEPPVVRRQTARRVLSPAVAARPAAGRPATPAQSAVAALLADLLVPGAPGAAALAAAGEPPRVDLTSDGFVRAVGAPGPARFVVRAARPEDGAGTLASRFMETHAAAFGIDGGPLGFGTPAVASRGDRTYVRLPQTYDGVPVLGAQAIVQLDAGGAVQFALATVGRRSRLPVSDRLPTEPRLGGDAAAELACAAVADSAGVAAFPARAAELAVWEPSLLREAGPPRLVWQVAVAGDEPWIAERVLVDALSGEIVLRFSEVASALQRTVRNAGNAVGQPGPVARSEGGPPTGDLEVDSVYDFCGDVYDFLMSRLGMDSLDGAGHPIEAHVRYCSSFADCPMHNAFWTDTTRRAYFGEGVVSDDIVAHELTHGVTSFAGGLIYWNEPGAINESMSDVFGELVDLTNGAGLDSPGNRWQVGEGSSLGVIRNMADPPLHGDPDRRYSPLWFTSAADNRGVHTNSGVGNKLAYLLVDGDTFRGVTVAGMGVGPVADLYDEVLQHLLTPSATYNDLYAALTQAAVNLAWSQAWRDNLERACRAVEIASASAPVTVVSEGFEGVFPGPGWSLHTPGSTNWGASGARTAGGAASAWCAGGGPVAGPAGGPYRANQESWLIYGPFSLAGAAQAELTFDFWLRSESGFDYFSYLVSTDGTTFVGRSIAGDLSGWLPEVLNLADLDGVQALGETQVWIAFLFESDSAIEYEGVYVDNVLLQRFPCGGAPGAPVLSAPPAAASGQAFTVSWSDTGAASYLLDEATGPAFADAVTYTVLGTSKALVRVGAGSAFHYRVRGASACGDVSAYSNSVATTIGAACTPAGIAAQPASTTVLAGQTATLSVTASGTSPIAYQWYLGASGDTASPLPGATAASLTTAPLTATTSFWVSVSNACGASDSAAATVTVAASSPAAFDFGTPSSPLAPGYARVTPATLLAAPPAGAAVPLAAGTYGWVSGTIDARDRTTGGDLNRDFNFTTLGTFAVAVANGAYDVRMTMGDATTAHDHMGIFLEGSRFDSATTSANQFAVKVYRGVAVADGQLTLLLDDEGGSDLNVVVNSLELTPSVPRKFDFGTASSPVAGGFVRVAEGTSFTPQRGYGWVSGSVASRDRGVGSDLRRDLDFATAATFAVALPNGTYSVRLTVGDAAAAHDQMGIFLEGVLRDELTTAANQFLVRTYTVTVGDGQLTVLLDDQGGADINVVVNALEVL